MKLSCFLVAGFLFPTIVACVNPSFSLNSAASTGDLDLVRRLVENGADVNLRTYDAAPIYAAACTGHAEVVEYLLANGADPSMPGPKGDTPLTCASYRGHQEVVKTLIQGGPESMTPLANGARIGSVDRWLITGF